MKSVSNENRQHILQGSLYKAIFALAIPLMLNNFIKTLYSLADAMWVGRLGATPFAATGFVEPVLMVFLSFGFGVSIAGTSLLSQLIGGKRHDEADNYARHLLVVALALAAVLTAVGYALSDHITRWMGATGDLHSYSSTYLSIMFLGFPFDMFFFYVQSVMNSQGITKAILFSNTASAVLNVLLDPFFIFKTVPVLNLPGLGWGIAGAAWATVLSKTILLFIGIFLVTRRSPEIRPVKGPIVFGKLKTIFSLALPAMIGQSGASLGFVLFNSFVVVYGENAVAAYGIGNRITDLLLLPAMGIGGALATIIGQNMGAGQVERADEGFRAATKICWIYTILGSVFVYFTKMKMIPLLVANPDEEILRLSSQYINHTLLTMPMMGMYSIFHGLFQGSGFTRYGMYMSLGRLWILRMPLILFFQYATSLGLTGIWISMNLSNLLADLYGYYLYRKGKWKQGVLT